MKIDGQLYNATILGYAKSKIYKFIISPEDGEVEIGIMTPTSRLQGPYKVEGNIIRMKIKGNGHLKIVLSELIVEWY